MSILKYWTTLEHLLETWARDRSDICWLVCCKAVSVTTHCLYDNKWDEHVFISEVVKYASYIFSEV